MVDSILSIFKVGIGPSSSHTVGPMVAGKSFVDYLIKRELLDSVKSVKIDLYGSLSLTGKGHLTDVATILGLFGFVPNSIRTAEIEPIINSVNENNKMFLGGINKIDFNPNNDVVFHKTFLALHENGMVLSAYDLEGKEILRKTYFSVGGGFIVGEEDFGKSVDDGEEVSLKYDFKTAEELLALCKKYNMSISQVALAREMELSKEDYIKEHYLNIWEVMSCSIDNGLNTGGVLPGGLKLKRRASSLYKKLQEDESSKKGDDFSTVEWLSAFALAVSEENAAGHRVVTAPTNGACAVVPAVIAYYNKFYGPISDEKVIQFLLVASAIGYIYKRNASISGAEAGCQAEIGAASSMAAGALAELFGASPEIACSAAEIAMEHHLGMTCDPVAGLVQIPCIERNAFGAVKSVMAAKMAMRRDSTPVVSLDNVIATMYATGKDMDSKYRETSEGGLAAVIKCPLS